MIQPPFQTASCMRAGTGLSPLVPSLDLAQGYCLRSTVSEIRQVLVLVEHIGSGGGQTPPPKKHTNPRHWAPCSEGEGGSWGSGCPSPRGPALGWAGELGQMSLEVTFQQQPKR